MSLLLDARRKAELALEQSGARRAVDPRLPEALRLEDLAADGRDARDPRAAGQNLFAAKAAPVRTEGRLGIIPIAIISGLVLAAGGGYYVWREISPAPVMQRHNPAPVAPVANATPPAAPATQTAPAPAAPAVENTHARANAGISPAHPLDTMLPHTDGRKERVGLDGQPGMKPIAEAPKDAAPYTPPAPHDTAAQPIRIEHGQESDAVDPTLLAAWQAYRNGDSGTALQRYSEVLRKDARNRDALLGMAAIAQQQSQDAIAARYYNQVLMLDPRDPVANAGMSALFGASDAAATESRLKLLLAQQLHAAGTQPAALHFALGNLYAEQSRWGDAQQAYSNALNLDPGNALFAFNLAVSLDHLGQGKLAARHYQRALQLDLSDNPGFSRAQTQRRINELAAP